MSSSSSARWGTVLVAIAATAVVACDSGAGRACDQIACVDDASCATRARCFAEQPRASIFPTEDPFARAVIGRVFRGPEGVSNALVWTSPTAAAKPSAEVVTPGAPLTTVDGGAFRFNSVALRYDFAARPDHELVVFENMGARYVDPSIGDGPPTTGWTARVTLELDPVPAADHAVAVFISGENAINALLAGDGGAGVSLNVSVRTFETDIDVSAVAYRKAGGLLTADAYGRATVKVRSGLNVGVPVKLDPLTVAADPVRVTVQAPAGGVGPPTDIVLDFGTLTSSAVIASVASGDTVRLPRVPFGRYAARVRSTTNAAVLDTGLAFFDATKGGTIELFLPEPPTPVAVVPQTFPDGGAGGLIADAHGIREHLLTPLDGAGAFTFRVVSADRAAFWPDWAAYGVSPPHGRYRWTVRDWPELSIVEQLSGPDVRAVHRSALSSPHDVVFP